MTYSPTSPLAARLRALREAIDKGKPMRISIDHLRFNILNPSGDLVASMEHAEDAAVAVAMNIGTTVTDRSGKVLWQEGDESWAAGDSYDETADRIRSRATA